MSRPAAVAQSFLKAGNLEAAEREALAVLERAPHDRDALEVLIEVALDNRDPARALALADGWVAREPDCPRAHQSRILALCRGRRKRQARQALDRYKADFPNDTKGYDGMWLGMETAFGGSEAVIKKVAGLRRTHGPQQPFDEVEALAKSRAGQLIGASRAADRVLKSNPLDLRALNIKATNAFRLCRLSQARALARQIRQLEPRKAASANELICASYAAYFPPFLAGQIVLMMVMLGSSRLPTLLAPVLAYMAAPLLVVPLVIVVEALADITGIPDFRTWFYLSMVGWIFYSLFIFQRITTRLGPRKSVELSDSY